MFFTPWAPGQETLRNELTGSTQTDMSHKMYKGLRMQWDRRTYPRLVSIVLSLTNFDRISFLM